MITLQVQDQLVHSLWITIVTTLFVLSLISERLANFVKLYFQSFYEDEDVEEIKESLSPRRAYSLHRVYRMESQLPKMKRDTKVGRLVGNLRYRQLDPVLEKQREKGILSVAILCGIAVSVFSGADLFHLIKTGELLDWQVWFENPEKKFWSFKIWSHIMGAVFAGFFVSLGSKFWHDVLDFVLYSSNLKRNLADPRTFQSSRIEEVDEWLAMYPGDLGRRAYEQYSIALNSQDNVAYTAHTSQYHDGVFQDVIRVYLKDDDDSRYRSQRTLPVKLESGRVMEVPLVIIKGVGDVPKVHGTTLKGVGIRRKGVDYTGTLCCLVENKSKEVFFLTCNHVLTEGVFKDLNNRDLAANIEVEILIGNKVVKGTWFESIQDDLYDIALIRPEASFKPDASFNAGIQLEKEPRTLFQNEKGLELNIQRRMKEENQPDTGKTSHRGKMSAYHLNKPIPIDYAKKKVSFFDLVELEDAEKNEAVSVGGDSGALVYDDSGKAVAMIIAGNKRFSYAIPMISILERTAMCIYSPLSI